MFELPPPAKTLGRVLASITLLMLAGCAAEPAHTDSATVPTRGGRAVVAIASDPGTLNPLRMANVEAARVFAVLQPGLFRLDPESGDWTPGLAASWTFAADSTSVDLALDTSYRWSDGEVFTADDVAASFALYLDPASQYARSARLDVLESVSAVDATTVRARFSQRVADPLQVLSHDILPAHVIEDLAIDEVESWPIGTAPVTLGSYRLSSWESNARLVLERCPHAREGEAWLDEIVFEVVPDAATSVLRLRSREVDVVSAVPMNLVQGLEKSAEVHLHAVTGRSVAFLQCNLQDAFLADQALRRAISLGIDRSALIDGPQFSMATAAATLIPPVSWAHAEALTPDAYDPEGARNVLVEAGYEHNSSGALLRDGKRVELTILLKAGDPIREAVASMIRSQLGELGIEVTTRPMEMGGLLRAASQGEFQLHLAQLSGPAGGDVQPFLSTTGRFNFGRYASESFDVLAAQASNALDRSEARDAAVALQEQVLEDLPVIPLYYPATVVASNPRLAGVQPTWLTPYDGIENWWIRAPIEAH